MPCRVKVCSYGYVTWTLRAIRVQLDVYALKCLEDVDGNELALAGRRVASQKLQPQTGNPKPLYSKP